MTRTTLLVLLAAALLLGPPPVHAQIGQTATLTGTVSDASGAVLPGVTITVKGESVIGGSRTTVTDENGTYRFPALPPGDYEVTAELSGFKTTSQQARLQLGQIITLDARLEVGGLTDRVTVLGAAPVVDVKSSSSQKNLDTEILENVPFGSRFGPDAIALSPGVNPNTLSSYGSGGSSGNSYMIDGVDVGDPESGTVWLFANYNWIQEVQVIGLGAGAEYRGLYRRRVQQPVSIGRQQVPRAVRNAVRERQAHRLEHQRRDPGSESRPEVRDHRLRH